MYDLTIFGATFWVVFWDWMEFAVRWLHVITAIAWIGSSFYFIALDLGLRKAPHLPDGAYGEQWQVHGGGFYHVQKYLTAPKYMPDHLTWFKWESYMTWVSGAALLAIVYWIGGELYLLDPSKIELELWQGVLISAASLTVGWIMYDCLCKSQLGEKPTALMLLLFVVLVLMSWGYNQVFTGRAALLHLGAFTATIMTANVFFIIMPNQRVVVNDLKAGRTPDPKYGKIAKLRSTHNNYLTLPVLFLMLSNHYPLAFATEFSWIIACLVFLMGVSIRHFFNRMHAGKERPYWTWAVTVVVFLFIVWLSVLPMLNSSELDTYEEANVQELTPYEQQFVSAKGFEDAFDTVLGNCSMCHAREPVWDGLVQPPKGIMLETEADVARNAELIFIQSGLSHAMPPPGAIEMDEEARRIIRTWYLQALSE